MKTKTFLTVILALILTTAISFSQKEHRGKGTIEDRIDHRLDKIDEVVKFTGTQRNDLKLMFTDLAKKKKDAICSNDIGTDGMKNAMKTIHKEQKDGLKKVLTNDQMKLLKAYKKEHKGEHKGKGRKKGEGGIEGRIDDHLNKMDEVVKFTGTQKNDMKALFTDLAKKKKDAFCANELGTDGMKDAMKAIREDKNEAMKKILTEDQIKLWKDHKKSNRGDKKDKLDKKENGINKFEK